MLGISGCRRLLTVTLLPKETTDSDQHEYRPEHTGWNPNEEEQSARPVMNICLEMR